MNRREFSKKLTAIAGTSLPLLSAATSTTHSTPGFSSLAHAINQAAAAGLRTHAVYDSRLGFQSVEIDQQFGKIDELHTYQGDVTSIWYQKLDPLWSAGKIVTAGVTRHTEFFLLRTMASENGHIVSHLEEYNEHACWLIQPARSSRD